MYIEICVEGIQISLDGQRMSEQWHFTTELRDFQDSGTLLAAVRGHFYRRCRWNPMRGHGELAWNCGGPVNPRSLHISRADTFPPSEGLLRDAESRRSNRRLRRGAQTVEQKLHHPRR